MKKSGRIIAVHLLNDLSGSPLVFFMVLQEYVKQGREVLLFTSSGKGFLSNLDGVEFKEIPYSWNKNKLLTLLNFIYVQCFIFIRILFSASRQDTVYVNTLLPAGALIAARLRGLKTIQHMHEVSVKPRVLFLVLCFVSEHCADKMIFVSGYLKGCFNFKRPHQEVVHNRLDDQFIRMANNHGKVTAPGPFTVLMLCSLKAYKGVYIFLDLAKSLPDIHFRLVLNASEQDIHDFIVKNHPSSNCEILPPSRNTHPYYRSAHVLVNLSLPDQWIETFGMTILEAKEYGIKVIAPPVGGPAEIVRVPEDGYLIDSRNQHELIQALNALHNDFILNHSPERGIQMKQISVA